MFEQEYELDYFKAQGFVRKVCPKCGKAFWTVDEDRLTCGDAPCDPYSFIGSPVLKRRLTLSEMREHYLRFFEERGHERIGRYPVVARWREDIYLTIASIADFQPFVTSGLAPPPANPLTISQPCIRLDDLDSVGRSGRHLTLFEMMAHHAFNTLEREVYWKERTVELCDELLRGLGVRHEDVTYKEEPWAGGGNAGPCLEVLVGGLELATLVFMSLERHPEGDITIKGERYRRMPSYIVDTGYGLERFVWASMGTPTIYDAVFGEVLRHISRMSGLEGLMRESEEVLARSAVLAGCMDVGSGTKLRRLREQVASTIGMDTDQLDALLTPIETMYAIADHTRCLTFMLGDGIVPSNVKAGYLARLVIRRTLRMMRRLGIEVPLFDIVKLHIDHLPEYPELAEMEDFIQEVLSLEEKRYATTIDKGKRLISRMLSKKGGSTLSTEELITLYDTHGIPPEITHEVASAHGVDVELPDNFYSLVAQAHSSEVMVEREVPHADRLKRLPATERGYYEHPEALTFEARVVDVFDHLVVLDRTQFYPEGGGQPADHGVLMCGNAQYDVVDVQMYEGVIVHTLRQKPELKVGDVVIGRVDAERRRALMRHHTATHIVNWAAKEVLGRHVWQAGAQKMEDRARLDLSHYRRITDEELRRIERLANKMAIEGVPVEVVWMSRTEAEKRYGFTLYQGGVPPGDTIRIVKVGEDVEACGGTHCEHTGNVGPIKIIRTERIQDGVERIEFAAGMAAVSQIQQRDVLLREAAGVFSVPIGQLPDTARRFFREWKALKKEVERLREEIAVLSSRLSSQSVREEMGVPYYSNRSQSVEPKEIIKRVSQIANTSSALACEVADDGFAVVAVPDELIKQHNVSASSIITRLTEDFDGGGGGKPSLAQGRVKRVPSKEELDEAIRRYIKELKDGQ